MFGGFLFFSSMSWFCRRREKTPQHPACPGRQFSLGLGPLGCWVLFAPGSGQRTLCWGGGGQGVFNSHARVTNCPLCATWVPRAGSPEGGEASGFSPVPCPDRAALCSGTCCLFRSFLVLRGGFAMATLSQGPSGSRNAASGLLGVWGLLLLPGAVLGGDRGVCVLAGSRQKRRCRTPKHERKPTGSEPSTRSACSCRR